MIVDGKGRIVSETYDAVVIGAGPAGLMAADELSVAGLRVLVAEAKPSVARKFLMAGKSGLNLTKDEPFEVFMAQYHEAADWLGPMVRDFDAAAVQDWARDLGQELFTGSTGRVFPKVMKASPLLRAWLERLDGRNVEIRTRWSWQGWADGALVFQTLEGVAHISARVTVLALGGASWSRLGSDGAWAEILQKEGVALAEFVPANAGLQINWSDHMEKHIGTPLKGVALHCAGQISRGETVISARGLEGGGVYPLSKWVRRGEALNIDLLPDLSETDVRSRLARPRGKASLSNHLRKTLKLRPEKLALLQEFSRPLPHDIGELATLIKALPVKHAGLRPMDEAISTAGGVPKSELDDGLMLRKHPGAFCAGEMLDWEAPTGGYLLTACFATGRWAGRSAVRWLNQF
ncbi:MAG: TIGR03862 family flavoprotein [Rhodobacteraceae bacterium]|nr:TIGR03862 family flavoprotein [Paracoccaceae bacterium]